MFGILPLIEEGLVKINNRGLPISPALQLLIALRFYATGSFQVRKEDIIIMLFTVRNKNYFLHVFLGIYL